MRPVLRPRHQPRPDRIERDVARRIEQMRLIDDDGAEPALDRPNVIRSAS
jgi:hypothetical protein